MSRRSSVQGRRVDLLMRGLHVAPDADPADAIRQWLRPGATAPKSSPEYLAKKPVVIIDPEPRRGEIIWPSELAGTFAFRSELVRESGGPPA